MDIKLYFFVIFFASIILTRFFLYFHPTPAPTINGFRIHHYMYGLVLAPVGALLENVTTYAVGIALFVDELGYLLIAGKTHEENYSKASLFLLALSIVLVYAFRKQLLFWWKS